MKHVLSIISLVLVLGAAASVHAFSNEEYKELMRVSPAFRAAEQQLTVTWKQVNAAIRDPNVKKKLLQEQRYWVWNGRDSVANAYMESGMDWASAYTQATRRRIDELRGWQAGYRSARGARR